MSGAQGLPKVIKGTATTTEKLVKIESPLRRGLGLATPKTRETFLRGDIRIANLSGSNTLQVRLNGQAELFTIQPNGELRFTKTLVFKLSVRSGASTADYDIVGIAA